MIRPATVLPSEVEVYSTEFRSLLEQLGAAEENFAFTGIFPELENINSLAALQRFLLNYQTQLLLPFDLPAICRAYRHANRNECRELVLLDQQLAAEPCLQTFSSASQRIGRIHLRRFRPMRERFVQRYLHAVDTGGAHGWHTLVFGMSLSLYSLPLRQGLNFYAEQVLRGFAFTATRVHRLSEREGSEMVQNLLANCTLEIEKFFAAGIVGTAEQRPEIT